MMETTGKRFRITFKDARCCRCGAVGHKGEYAFRVGSRVYCNNCVADRCQHSQKHVATTGLTNLHADDNIIRLGGDNYHRVSMSFYTHSAAAFDAAALWIVAKRGTFTASP